MKKVESDFSKFLIELRKEHKYTQQFIADLLFVERETVSKWERGINKPSVDVLMKLSQIYNVSLNEILLGKRMSENNISDFNNMTGALITKNVKTTKIIIGETITILVIFLVVLMSFFINNYKSLAVYKIKASNKKYSIEDGLLVITNDKAYLKIGLINNLSVDKIESYELYYKINNNVYNILESDNINKTLINDFANAEYFAYGNLQDILSDTHLDIKLKDNKTISFKLYFTLDYINKSIFKPEYSKFQKDEKNLASVPKYIKENYTYNAKEKCYDYTFKEGKLLYTYRYIVNDKLYLFIEHYGDNFEEFSYQNSTLKYGRYNLKNKTKYYFKYDLDNEKCVMLKCDKKLVKYFKSNYMDYIDFINNY